MRTAISTTAALSAGSAPGSPRHTGQTWVFGAPPNSVEQPQKILLRVRSWAWTSSPRTTWKSETGIYGASRRAPSAPPEPAAARRFQRRSLG